MTKLNLSEAARTAGITRATLYRHIKKGKLSKESDHEGNPLIDVSELMRVYPELNLGAAKDVNSKHASKLPNDAEQNTPGTPLLQLQLEQMERERDSERERRQQAEDRERETKEEIRRLISIIETQSKQLVAPGEEAITQPTTRRGFWSRLFS